MKNLTIILSILGLFAFVSCDKGEMGPVANTTSPGSPSITAPESEQSYTLLEENANDTLLTMEWTAPDFGVPVVTNYSIQATQDGDFSDPIQLATTNQTSWSITVQNMNNTLTGVGLPTGQETTLDFRVVASIADSVEEQVSEPISLGFTPYSLCQFCPAIYVPGGYQAASGYGSDWTPGDAPALGSVSGGDIYEGYVYFSSGAGFKLTGTNTGWDSNWGTPDNSGTLESGGVGNNLGVAQSGYYKIYADIPNLSYSLVRTEWGIIGTATADDWNSDQDMTFDSSSKTWSITTDLTSGALKFRANDTWDINYGPANADALQGDLIQTDGAINIPEAGNYTIEIDLNGTNYTYTVTQN
ncbi:SusE domain-containing protein [Fodinibius sp. AD559]|uniref:SusE domain-containing protein n=1 Tax=Fodinibius sp. AD559 TaxID=3424179 RepID=UPI004046DB75